MGLSTPITAQTLAEQGHRNKQVQYLKLFRADTAVKDLEAVRKCLTADYPDAKKKWSVLGQSYGGFVATTYLSQAPQGLREVFILGGLPPISQKDPSEVCKRLQCKIRQRNEKYYEKYPEDVEAVRRIAQYLDNHDSPVMLPDGGHLSPARFFSLGLSLGFHGGLDAVHNNVLRMINDLDTFGFLTKPTLCKIQSAGSFEDHPLYAIMHESIYCQSGGRSGWSANTLVSDEQGFNQLRNTDGSPLSFAGEMIFSEYFPAYPELTALHQLAEDVANVDDWCDLYDTDQLRRNQVPVYAATYLDDMYVDFDFAQETARTINGAKSFVTNAMYHDALRSCTEEVFKALFALRDDTID